MSISNLWLYHSAGIAHLVRDVYKIVGYFEQRKISLIRKQVERCAKVRVKEDPKGIDRGICIHLRKESNCNQNPKSYHGGNGFRGG